MPKVPARLSAPLKSEFRRLDQELDTALSSWFQQRDWERFAHVGPAEDMCEAAEALTGEGGPIEADLLAAVRELQAKWKANGPLPEAKNEELWPRFRSACDAAFEALKPWFEQRDAERGENLKQRQALIERLAVVVDDVSTIGLVGSAASKDHENVALSRFRPYSRNGKRPVQSPQMPVRIWTSSGRACWIRFMVAAANNGRSRKPSMRQMCQRKKRS